MLELSKWLELFAQVGEVLTMPTAVLMSAALIAVAAVAAVALVCAVFLLWRLCSWVFSPAGRGRDREPVPGYYYWVYLKPLWRGARWTWNATDGLGGRWAWRKSRPVRGRWSGRLPWRRVRRSAAGARR